MMADITVIDIDTNNTGNNYNIDNNNGDNI